MRREKRAGAPSQGAPLFAQTLPITALAVAKNFNALHQVTRFPAK
jgi:hypothetical protein